MAVGVAKRDIEMKIIKIEKCKHNECPYNYETFCFKVVEKASHKYGINHPKHFTRVERSGKYPFPDWCPLEDNINENP